MKYKCEWQRVGEGYPVNTWDFSGQGAELEYARRFLAKARARAERVTGWPFTGKVVLFEPVVTGYPVEAKASARAR